MRRLPLLCMMIFVLTWLGCAAPPLVTPTRETPAPHTQGTPEPTLTASATLSPSETATITPTPTVTPTPTPTLAPNAITAANVKDVHIVLDLIGPLNRVRGVSVSPDG